MKRIHLIGIHFFAISSVLLGQTGSSPAVVTAANSGWFANNGRSVASTVNASFANYAVGWDPVDFPYAILLRDFFVFNLTNVSGTITSATLDLYMPATSGYLSYKHSELYQLTSSTSSSSEVAGVFPVGSSAGAKVFNSLGTGTVFASILVSAADQGTTIHIPLNAAGLSFLNSNKGQTIVLGGQDPQAPSSGPTSTTCANTCRFFFTSTDPTGAGVFPKTPEPTLTLGFQNTAPPQVSLAGTATVSGDVKGDSPNGPAYVRNPNGFAFALTDGINTVSGQERRNNDATGGPNTALQSIGAFDGAQSTISGTVSALSLSDPVGGTQAMAIGLFTQGLVQNAATTYNSMLATPISNTAGYAALSFYEDNGHLVAALRVNNTFSPGIDLTAAGLANGATLSAPLPFTITFNGGDVSAMVGNAPVISLPVPVDLSNVVLFAGAISSNSMDNTGAMTYSNLTASLPATIGPPNLLYSVSGNNQSGIAGQGLAAPVVVRVVDAFRNPVAGVTVTFAGSNATASPATAQTDANGQATTQITLGNTVGAATITGTAGSLTATLSFSVTGSAAPVVNAVVNGASFAGGGVVAGEIATAFGINFTSVTGINLTSALPLPSQFLGVQVLVNDPAAPLFAVDNVNGQEQINFQVPWEVAGRSSVTIAVSDNSVTGSALTVPVLAAQPGVFTYTSGADTFGAILHANFQLADTGHPATTGETVLIYCTGLGAVKNPPADGAAGTGQATVQTPTVSIGAANAAVSFSGLAPGFVGLYQINAQVPAGLSSGNQPVIVKMAGASSKSVLLPVH